MALRKECVIGTLYKDYPFIVYKCNLKSNDHFHIASKDREGRLCFSNFSVFFFFAQFPIYLFQRLHNPLQTHTDLLEYAYYKLRHALGFPVFSSIFTCIDLLFVCVSDFFMYDCVIHENEVQSHFC